MGKLVAKIEGRGIGIKTSVVNMGDIARAIKTPPQYTTKWFGNELGAQSNYTNKQGEGERAVVNGSHEPAALQSLLDKFIEKYILCQNCHLPELVMKVKKNDIMAKCKACGWAGELDSTHRLGTFIRNNPPDETGLNVSDRDVGGKRDKKDKKKTKEDDDNVSDDDVEEKKEKKEKKDKKKKKTKKDKDGSDDDGSDDDKKKKKKKKSKKDKKEKKAGSDDDGSDDDDKKEKKKKDKKSKKDKKADSDDDSDADKKKKKKKDKKEKKKKDESDSDDDAADEKEAEVEALTYNDEEIPKVIADIAKFLAKGSPSVSDFFQEVRGFQVSKIFDDDVRLYAVISAIGGEKMDAKSLADKEEYVTEVIKKSKGGPLDYKVVLWCFNAYLSEHPDCKKAFPMVLKAIYDQDWASEKQILAYYTNDEGKDEPGFAMAKEVSKPFLDWLAKPDEDSSDDSDSNSDSS